MKYCHHPICLQRPVRLPAHLPLILLPLRQRLTLASLIDSDLGVAVEHVDDFQVAAAGFIVDDEDVLFAGHA